MTGTAVVLADYDSGRRMIESAANQDEVKRIRDKAQALAQYARLAKDTDLLGWVTEIKVRAERRCGELLIEQRANGKLAKRGKPSKMSKASTLTDADISRDDSILKFEHPQHGQEVLALALVAPLDPRQTFRPFFGVVSVRELRGHLGG